MNKFVPKNKTSKKISLKSIIPNNKKNKNINNNYNTNYNNTSKDNYLQYSYMVTSNLKKNFKPKINIIFS